MADYSVKQAHESLASAMPPWVHELKLAIESIGTDGARLRMPNDPRFCREGGLVSGQAISALADTAMVFALWGAMGEHKPVATIDLHVTFMRAAIGCDVIADAEVIRLGRTQAFARVTMNSSTTGQAVATAVGTFVVTA